MHNRSFNDPLRAELMGRATYSGYKAIGEAFIPIKPVERDNILRRLAYDDQNMVCTGCGSTKPEAYYKSIGAVSCCPERNMVPGTELLASLEKMRDAVQASQAHGGSKFADDYLEGAGAIATFLGGVWDEKKVYHARRMAMLPIRKLRGSLVYAFKSEMEAAMRAPEALPGSKKAA